MAGFFPPSDREKDRAARAAVVAVVLAVAVALVWIFAPR